MLKPQLPSQQCYELKFHQPSSVKQLIALKNALGKISASACYHGSANGYLRTGGGKKMRSQRTRNRGRERNKAGAAEVCPPVTLLVERGEEEQAVLKTNPVRSRATV